jgi:hypothetical protein
MTVSRYSKKAEFETYFGRIRNYQRVDQLNRIAGQKGGLVL